MSILHYFSKDADKRAKFIFNLIAPIYAIADRKIRLIYLDSIKRLENEVELRDKTILDIGTGTGAWAAMFLKYRSKVHGIDFSEKMIHEAKKLHPEISFSIAHAGNLAEIEDDSFDIVTASYVIHGIKADKRAEIITEMKRISRKYVVIHDYAGKTPMISKFLEFLEKSDYKNFKNNFCDELKTFFVKTKKTATIYGTGLYIAEK